MSVSAERAVQRAMVAALEVLPSIAIFEGPPPRVQFPYVIVGASTTGDWSTKTATGREVRAAATVWDDGETPARFHALMQDVETAMAAVAGTADGWRIASNVFLRSLIARDAAGPWSGLIEFRIRLLEI